jgi:signal transduction histidine kinase
VLTLRRVPELWRRFDGARLYLPIGLMLFVGSLVPALHSHGTMFGGMPNRPYDALAIVAVALQCLPLAVCRRWPAACLAVVSIGFAIDQLRGYHSFAGTALAFCVLNAGSRLERRRRATVLAFTVAYLPFVAAFHLLGAGEPAGEFLTFYVALVLVWSVGAWLRTNRAGEADRRRRVAEDTRAAERTRLARELHDVVTHHVTAMVMQAEAARYLTATVSDVGSASSATVSDVRSASSAKPDRLDQTLTVITDTGREAIADLRDLLDVLNPDYRAPSSARLRTLVERTRQAGQPVEFTEEGTPAESPGSPVAYRVVQEALTNALKYDHGSHTAVQVHHGEGEITVEVSTDGSGSRTGAPGGSGRGLAGLRARIDVLGGDFSAGSRTDGGFYVRARIPAGSTS